MHRIVHHTTHIRRRYDDICAMLDDDAAAILAEATEAARTFAGRIISELDGDLGFYDDREPLIVASEALERRSSSASMNVRWHGDKQKRLLPNVHARIEITPILSDGPESVSELVLHGEYRPPDESRGAGEFFLERRLVDAKSVTFLNHLAHEIEERI